MNHILIGDVRDQLTTLPDQSVQCVVTSPPYYGLRDYGVDGQIGLEPTVDEYVAALVDVFRGVRRVLRDDGTVWLNLGDSYSSGGNGAGSGRQLTNIGSHLPPKRVEGFAPKQLLGVPWRVAFALQADGWWLRQDIIWSKPNPMPESVTDRCTKAHEYVFMLTKAERYFYDADAVAEPAVAAPMSGNGYKRPAQLSREGRGSDVPYEPQENRNRRSVWTIPTRPFPEAHFATFPEALVEPCILAGSRSGDMVLDPFGGSGTVGVVAERLGRRWTLIELNPDYAAMAQRRTAQRGFLAALAAEEA